MSHEHYYQQHGKVLVIFPDPSAYAEPLQRTFPQIEVIARETLDDATDVLEAATVLITTGFGVTAEVVERMTSLQWMQILLSGVDHVTGALERRRDVLLTSGRGVHGPQVSEMALLHMLALSRGVRRLTAAQASRTWRDEVPQRALAGSTVCIVGFGVIGHALARRCRALEMRVTGVSRTVRDEPLTDAYYPVSELREAVADADFVVAITPLTAETERLIDGEIFAAMKPTAYLINVARGPVVDEPALIAALQSGQIAGAGLDVFTQEPLPQESPLWGFEDVFITPRIAGRRQGYEALALAHVVEPNLRAWLDGDRTRMINIAGH